MERCEDNLKIRLQYKIKKETAEEFKSKADYLKEREDFRRDYSYFLDIILLSLSWQEFSNRFKRPFAGAFCLSVPVELLDAFGFHPLYLCSGSMSSQQASSSELPVLSCPIIKSCVGNFNFSDSLENACDLIVIPTTCDWKSKLPDMLKERFKRIHIMELTPLKESKKAQKIWLEEIYSLKKRLEELTGKPLKHKMLFRALRKYAIANDVFMRFIDLRRKGLICGIWSIIITNAFMLDDVELWAQAVEKINETSKSVEATKNPSIFLAGSPLFFPNLKMMELIESSGMHIAADNLCTSERLLNNVAYDDASEYGVLRALAESRQLPCECPAFLDNGLKIKNIIHQMRQYNIKGLVYHVLKGCHPCDLESFSFERKLKENGYRFLKIETDYSYQDRENILMRLEAFKETL